MPTQKLTVINNNILAILNKRCFLKVDHISVDWLIDWVRFNVPPNTLAIYHSDILQWNSTKYHAQFTHMSVDWSLLNMRVWSTFYLAIQIILTTARSNVLGTGWVVAGGRGNRAVQRDKCRERIVTTCSRGVTGNTADTVQNVIIISICHIHSGSTARK